MSMPIDASGQESPERIVRGIARDAGARDLPIADPGSPPQAVKLQSTPSLPVSTFVLRMSTVYVEKCMMSALTVPSLAVVVVRSDQLFVLSSK